MFQSTRPAWGATSAFAYQGSDELEVSIHAPCVGRDGCSGNPRTRRLPFQSTRPAWGATYMLKGPEFGNAVSIHAPCVGRDPTSSPHTSAAKCFNPRALRGARRHRKSCSKSQSLFQSTRPAWGATRGRDCWPRCKPSFNPRALRGARRRRPGAPSLDTQSFNPRALRGARPSRVSIVSAVPFVSIHAPCVGRDSRQQLRSN